VLGLIFLVNQKIQHPSLKEQKVHVNFYSKMICNWIIKEVKSYNKNSNFAKINIEHIPHIFRFCFQGLVLVLETISKLYELNNIKININGIFIINEKPELNKLSESNETVNLVVQNNKSFLKATILLSDPYDFKQDILDNNQGDLIINSNVLPDTKKYTITEGNKYSLVYYLELIYK
jgi:hypothetical protein